MEILQEETSFIDSTNEMNKLVELTMYDNRTIIIDRTIDADILRDVIIHIVQWNSEDKNIPKDKRTPIKIIIDSEGGNSICANNLIDVIKSSTTPVYGIAFSIAASAAAYIFIVCDKRYAFKHSTILLHDGTQAVYHTSNKAKDTMHYYDNIDAIIKNIVIEHTNIGNEEYDKNKDRELFLFADEAKEKGIVDYIIDVDVALDDVL